MAARKGYPAIPSHIWWALRQKFIQSYPREVTRDYLSTALGLGEKVAQNVHPPLKQLGLVDEENRPTDLAERWRDDARYSDAAREIVEAVYPQALRDVSPPDAPDVAAATRWFLNDTKSGSARAKQLATFYVLLAKGDPADTAGSRPRRGATIGSDVSARRQPRDQEKARGSKRKAADGGKDADASPDLKHHALPIPSLNLAVQVYIDKEMTPEQVDHVFASMARHLYGKE